METHCCFGTVTGYADGGMTVREFRDFDQMLEEQDAGDTVFRLWQHRYLKGDLSGGEPG